MLKLIKQLEKSIAKADKEYNSGMSPSDDYLYIAEELQALGLGAVYIKTPIGKLAWFDLQNMEF